MVFRKKNEEKQKYTANYRLLSIKTTKHVLKELCAKKTTKTAPHVCNSATPIIAPRLPAFRHSFLLSINLFARENLVLMKIFRFSISLSSNIETLLLKFTNFRRKAMPLGLFSSGKAQVLCDEKIPGGKKKEPKQLSENKCKGI